MTLQIHCVKLFKAVYYMHHTTGLCGSYSTQLYTTFTQLYTTDLQCISRKSDYAPRLCFTWTANSSIFGMVTVMDLKSVTGAVKETRFISTALNIIEGDVSRALSIAAPRGSGLSIPVPHAPTKNLCVIHVPFIITHGSPGAVVKHFHTPLPVGTTTDQLCIWWLKIV